MISLEEDLYNKVVSGEISYPVFNEYIQAQYKMIREGNTERNKRILDELVKQFKENV